MKTIVKYYDELHESSLQRSAILLAIDTLLDSQHSVVLKFITPSRGSLYLCWTKDDLLRRVAQTVCHLGDNMLPLKFLQQGAVFLELIPLPNL